MAPFSLEGSRPGFGVEGLGLCFGGHGLFSKVHGFGFGGHDLWFMVCVLWFRVHSSRFRPGAFGCRDTGLVFRV